jgi:hypothetical protein
VTKLLMGRGLFNSNRAKRPPLLIDVESREVTSLTGDVVVPAVGPIRPTILTDGAAVIPDYFGCWLLKPSFDNESGWSSKEIPFSKLGPGRDQSLPWGVVSKGRVVFPGPVWRSLDPGTGNVDRINAKPLAPQWEFEDYAASGPFGFVAWNRGDHLYRVHFEKTEQAKVTLGGRFPSIPKEQQARHHAAVTRLRELGATVELQWGRFERSRFLERRASKEWQSVAWFPSSWKGDDRDFALLQDVYNLRELALVGAPATDDYCSTIGQLKGLHYLAFEETKVTDAGLGQLGKLPELAEVRFQSRAGHADFTNAAFNVVAYFPRLERLIVYGDGFTDEGLQSLPRQILFHRLCLLDTKVSDTAAAKLKSSRRNFIVKRHAEYNRP